MVLLSPEMLDSRKYGKPKRKRTVPPPPTVGLGNHQHSAFILLHLPFSKIGTPTFCDGFHQLIAHRKNRIASATLNSYRDRRAAI